MGYRLQLLILRKSLLSAIYNPYITCKHHLIGMIKHKKNYKKKQKHATRNYNTYNNNFDKSVKPIERANDNNSNMPQHVHRTTEPSHNNVTKANETIPEVLDYSKGDAMKELRNIAEAVSPVQQEESLDLESLGSINPSPSISAINAQRVRHIAEEKISSIVNESGQAGEAPQPLIGLSQEQKYIEQKEEKRENNHALEHENLSTSVIMPWLNYIAPCTEAYNEIIKNSMAVSEYWLKLFTPWTKKLD
jgi:hypothetical protein